ncbi:hypothetical protein Sfulv_39460 [Streptomyces fulvorobeus]|uniref:Uncharacterized protein n=1 Tax=Streptomyces fulvorobeus TaxID=284028 RepID=A0A7J0C9C8_9ACTN|nr:hypothetical protein Sfulv_39460 [Streptomyces fulvorobeus]
MNAYRIELRRSPLLTALPVMIAVDLVVLFGRARYWIGVWPEASVAAQVVTLFLGPVLAGVSAWQAGRSSRAGMPEAVLAAARPGWRIESARLAATLTLGFLAYAIGCVTAAAISFGEAGPGFPTCGPTPRSGPGPPSTRRTRTGPPRRSRRSTKRRNRSPACRAHPARCGLRADRTGRPTRSAAGQTAFRRTY